MVLLLEKVKANLHNCIVKCSLSVGERKHLVTLAYLFDAIKLVTSFPEVDGLALEGYFYATETQSTASLTELVMGHFEKD